MTKNLKQQILAALPYLLVSVLFISTSGNSFFWDTVQLASKHATFYYTNNFSELLLPNHLDSGHITTFGMYIALVWKVFGRSLLVSHLAMLPFVIGIVFQLRVLCKRFIDPNYLTFGLFLVLLDPTLLSQMTLVSPDVVLVFFFLLCVNAIFVNNRWLICLSVCFLFLTSMRGMMVSSCLLLLDLSQNTSLTKNIRSTSSQLLKRSILYVPALLIFIVFSTAHYLEKGWIGYHADSPWMNSFEAVDMKGVIRNFGILGWRLLDFGRIGAWLVGLLLVLMYRKRIFQNKSTRVLFYFFLVLVILLPLNMLWANNLVGHRYLLPIYLTFSIFVASILFSPYVHRRIKNTLGIAWAVILLTGNLWIYPDTISQGWDSTLAHLPYYDLRQKTIAYLDKNEINTSDVTSFFPNVAAFDEIDLNGNIQGFKNFDGQSTYAMYSTVFNISDSEYQTLITLYHPIYTAQANNIKVILYMKNL